MRTLIISPNWHKNPGAVAWALFLETGRWKAMDCWFSLASQPSLIDKLWVKEESLSPRGRWWLRSNGIQDCALTFTCTSTHTQVRLYRKIHTYTNTHTWHTHTLHEKLSKLLKPHFTHREVFRSKRALMLSVGDCWSMQSKLRRNGSSQVKESQPKNMNNVVTASAYLYFRHELDHGFIMCPWTSRPF